MREQKAEKQKAYPYQKMSIEYMVLAFEPMTFGK